MRTASIGFLPAVAWMGLIFLLSSREQFPQPTVLSLELLAIGAHLLMYGVLAVLLFIPLRHASGAMPWAAMLAVALSVAYGLTDEYHQSFVPGRDASLFDIVVDAVGAAIGVAIWSLLTNARRIRCR